MYLTVVTLAGENAKLVTGKIIARLLSAVEATGHSDARHDLSEHKLFPTIALLARFLLMVSFDNLIDVEQFLPEVVYVCSLLFAQGDLVHRVTVHRLLINLVHSAYLLQQSMLEPEQQPLYQQQQQQQLTPRRPSKKGQMKTSSRSSDRPAGDESPAAASAVASPVAAAGKGEAQGSDRVLMFLRELDEPRVAVHFGFGQHLSVSPFSNPSDLRRKGPPARVPLESARTVAVTKKQGHKKSSLANMVSAKRCCFAVLSTHCRQTVTRLELLGKQQGGAV